MFYQHLESISLRKESIRGGKESKSVSWKFEPLKHPLEAPFA